MDQRQKKAPSLKQQMLDKCRMLNRSYKTADAYWKWCEQFLRYHCWLRGNRPDTWVHPREMGRPEIESFLTYLATKRNVSPSTQNQAFAAILFLYKQVLDIKIEGVDALRAKKPSFIPTVLSESEVVALLAELSGRNRLIAYLCYGAGLRIGEVFELRVKDVDFGNNFIHIRQAKGGKDRIVQLPEVAIPLLKQQIEETRKLHALDTAKGRARVPLPFAFAKKSPRSAGDLGWYWVFCSEKYLDDDKRQLYGRWHYDSTTFTKPLADGVRTAKPPIFKRVTAHTLRHSFATHLMNNRVPLVAIQELMGHSNLETTRIYMHVEQASVSSTTSPLDGLLLRT